MLTPLYAFGSGKTTKTEFFKTATCVSWDNSLQEKKKKSIIFRFPYPVLKGLTSTQKANGLYIGLDQPKPPYISTRTKLPSPNERLFYKQHP